MSNNTANQNVQGAILDSNAMLSNVMLKAILERLNSIDEKLKGHDGRFDEMNTRLSVMNSKIRELENDVRDISSINNTVRRMDVGFQEIPQEMTGRSAVEEIKDFY